MTHEFWWWTDKSQRYHVKCVMPIRSGSKLLWNIANCNKKNSQKLPTLPWRLIFLAAEMHARSAAESKTAMNRHRQVKETVQLIVIKHCSMLGNTTVRSLLRPSAAADDISIYQALTSNCTVSSRQLITRATRSRPASDRWNFKKIETTIWIFEAGSMKLPKTPHLTRRRSFATIT